MKSDVFLTNLSIATEKEKEDVVGIYDAEGKRRKIVEKA
jgi:hypothetical protein